MNFNAGTLGHSMVEGRISAGVVVGDGSDVGGGASIMGTLSGGGTAVISIGERCLLGANSGLGISLGDDCVVEAGLYLTAGARVALPDGEVVKARELSGAERPAVPPQLPERARSRSCRAAAQLGRPQRRATCQPVARPRARTRRASGRARAAGSRRRRRRSTSPGVRITPRSSSRSWKPGGRALEPQEERRVAARVAQAARLQRRHEHVALGPVDVPHRRDVVLVAPRRDRGELDELRRRDADVRPVALQRRHQLGVAGHEPRAVARHRRALGQRVEHRHVRAVGDLQRRRRRLGAEVQLRVRLVGRDHEVVRREPAPPPARTAPAARSRPSGCSGSSATGSRSAATRRRRPTSRSGRKPALPRSGSSNTCLPANTAPRSYTGYAGCGTTTSSPSSTCARWNTASLEPNVGTTSESGSSATPNRRAAHAAIAARSSGRPSACG